MAVQHLATGGEPHLRVSHCGGDLDVRGTARHEIDLTDESQQIVLTSYEEGVVAEALVGNCAIQMPEGSRLTLGEVGGCVRIKGVLGIVTIEQIGGDCMTSRTGPLTINSIGGEAHLRRSSGEIGIGQIGGDVALRDIQGMVRIMGVSGDCALRNCPSGAQLDQVGGDLTVRTDLNPESAYHLTVSGDVEICVPTDAGARVYFPSHTDFRPGEGMTAAQEGDQTVVTIGDGGSTTIMVNAGGALSITQESAYGPEEDFGFAFDRDIEAMMDDVSARLDSNLRHLEVKLQGLPDRVRHKVERKLEKARQHVEAAGRHARQAAERAHGIGGDEWAGRGGAASDEPVSDSERLTVLRMVEEGKITVSEAQILLAALEDKR